MIMTTTTRTMARPPKPPKPERGTRRYTPLPDPPKKIDAIQFKHVNRAYYMLEDRYEGDPATFVDGKMYLRQCPRERSGFAVPDCMIAFGVEADELDKANGYVISEVGKPPDFILDIASKIVGVRDYTVKRRIYANMKAPESWRFDPSGGRYHDAPLAGDILVDGEYHSIQIAARPDGTFWGYSAALDLFLVWEEGWLRFYDTEVGEFLPTVAELRRAREDAERRAAVERAARIRADRRAARTESDRRASGGGSGGGAAETHAGGFGVGRSARQCSPTAILGGGAGRGNGRWGRDLPLAILAWVWGARSFGGGRGQARLWRMRDLDANLPVSPSWEKAGMRTRRAPRRFSLLRISRAALGFARALCDDMRERNLEKPSAKGGSIMSGIWRGDTKCVAMLGFDIDGASSAINRNPASANLPSLMSMREYGPSVAMPRILDLLERRGIPASFYIPGYVAETHEALVRDIHSRGHEIAHHGYMHEPPATLSRAEEADVLDRGIEILERLTGERPTGYRSPSWELSEHSLELLADRGFSYDSSLMGDDVPYIVHVDERTLVEIPVQWELDDAPYFNYAPSLDMRPVMASPRQVYDAWSAAFEGAYEYGLAFTLTMHPYVIGRPGRLRMLERLLDYIAGFDGVEFRRAADVAREWGGG